MTSELGSLSLWIQLMSKGDPQAYRILTSYIDTRVEPIRGRDWEQISQRRRKSLSTQC